MEKAKCTYLNFEPKDPDISYEGKTTYVINVWNLHVFEFVLDHDCM